MTHLKGIAWNHTRGFLPVVATAQRFEEQNPDITISWEKRSLQAFADAPMEQLAEQFDLIVMDHPHTALAATKGLILPFEDWVSADFLAEQAANSVGVSHESYCFGGKHWTLATDAATPISTWRPDLMDRHGLQLPETWEDVLEMARKGFVTVAAFPIDVLMHSYMFCDALGHTPFGPDGEMAPLDVLEGALEELRRLIILCDPACRERNPIRTGEWMSSVDDDPHAAYCPFAYGYSNYSRRGYVRHALTAGGLVTFVGKRLRSTLGGAGVAVSAKSKHPRAAMDYAEFTATPWVQRGVYFESGGQPGHRSAWTDSAVNAASNGFFADTLETHDQAICRPKATGYMMFQNTATPIAHDTMTGKRSISEAAREILKLWRIAR
jgi:multiple sugar transport system substrate-binding protein